VDEDAEIKPYSGPAGGWESVKAVGAILTQEEVALLGSEILLKQNKTDGFMCVSCSWAKPASPHPFEFCENGAKATAWEITTKTTTPEFFSKHTLTELRTWTDLDLEDNGRLTHPMRYDAGSDKYVPVAWEHAFQAIGDELKKHEPSSVVFYSSGRASLEASYMYQLFGRMYGTNNFPDSSNMCHESTSVALPEVIGVPVGTVLLSDFDKTDCIFFFGHNTTTNAPRMLHALQAVAKRGKPIVTFNPLRERGLERFTDPQSPVQMVAVRDAIEATYPQYFKNFNDRLFTPGGFPRPLPARERKWSTPNGKANFTCPENSVGAGEQSADIYRLMTIRGDGQFNTTIYTNDDRFLGVYGGRLVVLINPKDIERLGIKGEKITLATVADDGIERTLSGLQVAPYDIPMGCIAGYYPECNGARGRRSFDGRRPADASACESDSRSLGAIDRWRYRPVALRGPRTGPGRHHRIGGRNCDAPDGGLPASRRESDRRQCPSHQSGRHARSYRAGRWQ
jgi:anaerobic selenocysteine-containing dehydrogenase